LKAFVSVLVLVPAIAFMLYIVVSRIRGRRDASAAAAAAGNSTAAAIELGEGASSAAGGKAPTEFAAAADGAGQMPSSPVCVAALPPMSVIAFSDVASSPVVSPGTLLPLFSDFYIYPPPY
jgi:hypothetical protein